jgi:outer membrane protein assembly factor BamD (BamD/ComL family)
VLNKSDVEAYSWLVQVYISSKQYEKAIQLLEEWIMNHPNDPNAKEELEKIKEMVSAGVDTSQ